MRRPTISHRHAERLQQQPKKKEPVQHFKVQMIYGKDALAEALNHGWEAGWTRVQILNRGTNDGFTIIWFTQHGFRPDE